MTINPAEQLIGHSLNNGWTVIEKNEKASDATGGFFSQGYIVQGPNGVKGFLKAIDYSNLFGVVDSVDRIREMMDAFVFERDLLKKCGKIRLSHVVQVLDDGQYTVPENPMPPVPYLIFEIADGDVRNHIGKMKEVDNAWLVRSLHNAAVGLMQLHGQNVAHQDIKPSNILIFNAETSKIGDVGRAIVKGQTSPPPHVNAQIAGARQYAPPELLYGAIPTEWGDRRLGCDLYLLGSLIMYYFVHSQMTVALQLKLHEEHRYNFYKGSFDEVLPYISHAFSQVIGDIEPTLPEELRSDLSAMIRYLCAPDPSKRGHPRNRSYLNQNPYGLERTVAALDLLARKTETKAFSLRSTL